MQTLKETLHRLWDDMQARKNQFVVGYYDMETDELIGYHASTFHQLTSDILDAKRYAGDNPYEQVALIADNFKQFMARELDENDPFYSVRVESQHPFKGKNVYLNAVDLAAGTPKQECRWTI